MEELKKMTKENLIDRLSGFKNEAETLICHIKNREYVKNEYYDFKSKIKHDYHYTQLKRNEDCLDEFYLSIYKPCIQDVYCEISNLKYESNEIIARLVGSIFEFDYFLNQNR